MSGQFLPFLFKNEGAQVFGGTVAVCIAGCVIGKLWFASSKPRHQPPPWAVSAALLCNRCPREAGGCLPRGRCGCAEAGPAFCRRYEAAQVHRLAPHASGHL